MWDGTAMMNSWFGERGETKLIVSVSCGHLRRSSNGRVSPVLVMMETRAGLAMGDMSLSWMVNARTIVRIPVRIRNELTSVKQHAVFYSFLRTGVACCLPPCARGFSLSKVQELVGHGVFFGDFGFFLVSCASWVC